MGSIFEAIRAPNVDINPSITIGTFREAAPKIRPAIDPISRPPTLDNTSMGSSGFGLFTYIAFLITWNFNDRPESYKPVPLPTSLSKDSSE